ncbi:hypothetical protein CVT26_004069 [Gymnopilus dilepis]|uniref:ribonuclease H n=1 Tax=Gymnopilus dilepis TaxID=231916 RepID=A0A409YMM3_9AGAR|nr:hypothetical protein CVT26_004069 [Gymnopilus dilepis]
MTLPDNNHVEDRKAIICLGLQNLDIKQLVLECKDCHRFFASCCQNGFSEGGLYKHHGRLCHHAKVVFTDGACTNNGSALARSGLGVTIGGDNDEFDYSWSIPVTDAVDVVSPRTSQRAELLAALEGLKMLEAFRKTGGVDVSRNHSGHARDDYRDTYLVVTDSEYVVKGMTEWLPSWKRRGLRTSSGKRPTNLDLFLELDRYVTKLENDRVAVGFWHVPRTFNQDADALAKRAASIAT